MKLSALLEDLEFEILSKVQAGLDTEVSEITLDSRKAREGCLFVCIKGAVVDGHKFAPDVAKAGAAVLVVEDEVTVGDAGGSPGCLRHGGYPAAEQDHLAVRRL